jgi:hypothetical protein
MAHHGLSRHMANCLGKGWPARKPAPAATMIAALSVFAEGSISGVGALLMVRAGNPLPGGAQSFMRCPLLGMPQ